LDRRTPQKAYTSPELASFSFFYLTAPIMSQHGFKLACFSFFFLLALPNAVGARITLGVITDEAGG
jgi:nitrate/nitrite transporter NarK